MIYNCKDLRPAISIHIFVVFLCPYGIVQIVPTFLFITACFSYSPSDLFHITTVPRPLFQPTATNDYYLFTFLLILYEGQASEFWGTSKNGMFFFCPRKKCQSLFPINSPFNPLFYCCLTSFSLFVF